MNNERLKRQIEFIVEIDKVKKICRQTLLMDGSRNENDAEHSWHLALMAMVLSEYAPRDLDLCKVIKMVLVHDLVEIDAGDTFCYDEKANEDKAEREQEAANRIFGLLPPDQEKEFRSLWEEFEKQKTPEAKFAASLDRMQPLLSNYHTNGHTWVKYDVKYDKVVERMKPIEGSAPELWKYVLEVLEDSIEKGYLKRE